MLIYGALCYFGPKDMNIKRNITIQSSPDIIFNLVNHLPSLESWLPWLEQDSTMVLNFSDIKEGVGAKYSWTSDKMGNGNTEIIESVTNESIKTKLSLDGNEGSFGNWTFKNEGERTAVSWGMSSEDPIPIYKRGVMLIMGIKNQLSSNFDLGLLNIKEIAESRNKGFYNVYQIKQVELPERHYIMNRGETRTDRIQQFYASNLGALFMKVQPTDIELNGMPSCLFFKYDDENNMTDMAAAIPITEDIAVQNTTNYSIPAKSAVQIDYYGDSSKTANAHKAIREYLKDRSLISDVPMIEEYVTDPDEERDPSKWLTTITYYLANQKN